MLASIRAIFGDSRADLRGRILGLFALLSAANGLAWLAAFLAFRGHPLLIGTALLAYSFGLRHAVDADHIAAIDNVTRKLMQEGKRPVTVGFFFSLGHSTVVVLASAAVAGTALALQSRFDALKEVGGIVGTSISALFLFAVAMANLAILVALYRSFRAVKHGAPLHEADFDALLAQRGFLGRWLRPVFRLVDRSWQMYPVGFLFGLGFDTATEIGLLGIAAAEASKGLPIWSIMVFPALFTAGMSLIDSADAVLMVGAYGWAFVKPIRKLYYNMTVTFVSVVAALLIGGVEALGLIGDEAGLRGGVWDLIGSLNDHFGAVGYALVALFAVSWLVSAIIYRVKRYDELETRSG
jgi:high-affinity nickel-transport protein